MTHAKELSPDSYEWDQNHWRMLRKHPFWWFLT
jgi:hypothetical protein